MIRAGSTTKNTLLFSILYSILFYFQMSLPDPSSQQTKSRPSASCIPCRTRKVKVYPILSYPILSYPILSYTMIITMIMRYSAPAPPPAQPASRATTRKNASTRRPTSTAPRCARPISSRSCAGVCATCVLCWGGLILILQFQSLGLELGLCRGLALGWLVELEIRGKKVMKRWCIERSVRDPPI